MVVDDIFAHLETNSLIGGSSGWTGYKGFMPDSPDNAVGIFNTGGAEPEKGFSLRYPTFQIRVRGVATEAGRTAMIAKEEAIYALLHAIANATINSVSYAYVIASSDLLDMGRDKKRRPEMTRNYRTAINN